MAAAGLVLLYVSSLARLRFGEWPVNSIRILLDNMHSQWPNADWIAKLKGTIYLFPVTILDAPLWIIFLVIGGSIYLLGWILEESTPKTEHA